MSWLRKTIARLGLAAIVTIGSASPSSGDLGDINTLGIGLIKSRELGQGFGVDVRSYSPPSDKIICGRWGLGGRFSTYMHNTTDRNNRNKQPFLVTMGPLATLAILYENKYIPPEESEEENPKTLLMRSGLGIYVSIESVFSPEISGISYGFGFDMFQTAGWPPVQIGVEIKFIGRETFTLVHMYLGF